MLWQFQEQCPCTRQDFIIFAEFSEVMGPVPLLTIPRCAEDIAGIEINNFIMRIMSVDYQANPRQVDNYKIYNTTKCEKCMKLISGGKNIFISKIFQVTD
jgi:hypothetical protein